MDNGHFANCPKIILIDTHSFSLALNTVIHPIHRADKSFPHFQHPIIRRPIKPIKNIRKRTNRGSHHETDLPNQ